MNKSRLEAFSDGVLAIIITIMVLEIKVPHSADWAVLRELTPVGLSYLISFLFVGIYWGNHHHLLHAARSVKSGMMLANLNLLFWLSLVPFATGWMGENHFAPNTIIAYAGLAIVCGLSYWRLQHLILKDIEGHDRLRAALERQSRKALFSISCDLLAIPLAFVNPVISGTLFFLQSALWLVPDKELEHALNAEKKEH